MTRALTPYEERNEYYATIQLGRDVKAQTELISKQTRELVTTQLASANGIIASQERISEGIDEISYRIEDVAEGIYGLKAAFEWGIDEVVWQIEQNREVLKNILEAITKPLDTQAKELRRRAEKAYANGWIDDALEDFLESEKKNRYDFVVHISLGHIYLFHEHNNAKALEYYQKAVKYARPESSYYTSYALIHMAFIKYLEKQVEEAERYTKEAIQLSPDFTEALYRNAQYNAILCKVDKAIPSLERAIKIDVNYCEKANNEKEFDEIKADVKKLFEKLRREERNKVDSRYKNFREKLNVFNDLKTQVEPEDITTAVNTELGSSIQRVDTLIQRNSYRDYLEAGKILSKAESLIVEEISGLQKKVQHETKEKTKIATRYKKLREMLNLFNDLKSQVEAEDITIVANTKFETSIRRVDSLIQRNSYRDYLEARGILSETEESLAQEISNLQEKVHHKKEECSFSMSDLKQKQETTLRPFFWFLYVLPLVSYLLYVIIRPEGREGIGSLIFVLIVLAIPVLNLIVWIVTMIMEKNIFLWIMTIVCIAGYWMIRALPAHRISSNIKIYSAKIRRLERIEKISRDIERGLGCGS